MAKQEKAKDKDKTAPPSKKKKKKYFFLGNFSLLLENVKFIGFRERLTDTSAFCTESMNTFQQCVRSA